MKVYVANLGKYNEGELVGAWFDLPMHPSELWKKLASDVGINKQYEEYAIHDCQETNYRPREFDNLFDLNLMAVLEENASEWELEAVEEYEDNIERLGVFERCNFILQADEIPYYQYGYDGSTPEERYGRMYWDECYFELSREQKNLIEDFIDFHAFGRYISADDYLCDNGYLVGYGDYPDQTYFSRKELIEKANELGWC